MSRFGGIYLLFLTGLVSGFPSSNVILIDLSHPAEEGHTADWPGSLPFSLKIVNRGFIGEEGTPGRTYFELNDFSQNEHSGTHTDAPSHFAKGAWRVGDIPLERLIGPAVIVDISHKARSDPDASLTVEDILKWEEVNGRMPELSILLMYSGWVSKYADKDKYFGKDKDDLHFPGLDRRTARWLMENRNIVGYGVDTPSVDKGNDKDLVVHQIICKESVWGLENLNLTPEIIKKSKDYDITIWNMVYKIKEGSGAPSRVTAVLTPRKTPIKKDQSEL